MFEVTFDFVAQQNLEQGNEGETHNVESKSEASSNRVEGTLKIVDLQNTCKYKGMIRRSPT